MIGGPIAAFSGTLICHTMTGAAPGPGIEVTSRSVTPQRGAHLNAGAPGFAAELTATWTSP